MESFKSPPLCSSCGSPNVTATWIISNRKDRFSAWTFLTMPFGVSTTRRTTYTFEMPVCSKCKAKLDAIDKITRGINLSAAIGCAGIIAIGFIVLLATGDEEHSIIASVFFAAILAVLGVPFGAAIGKIIEWIIKYLTVYDFCDFDGRYFHFDNKKFEHEFAMLNPGWVKPRNKWF